jgi:hypothetical protein
MEHDKRIQKILGENRRRNQQNSSRYLEYIKSAVKLPCRLTGIEDFPWEERYVIGGWDKDEYEELKKENPSYTDVFEVLELLEPDRESDDIIAKLKRLTDLKIFEVGLSWLKCLDSDDENYQLIEDYAVWHTNY